MLAPPLENIKKVPYYLLIKGRKPMMRVHKEKGLWPRVIRSMGETSLEVSRVETNLNLNRGKGRIFSVTSEGKRGT